MSSLTATRPKVNTEAPAPTRGLLLPCPLCGEENATIRLDLSDMDALHCVDCETDFTVADVRARLARWRRVLSWIAAAPTAEEGGAE